MRLLRFVVFACARAYVCLVGVPGDLWFVVLASAAGVCILSYQHVRCWYDVTCVWTYAQAIGGVASQGISMQNCNVTGN